MPTDSSDQGQVNQGYYPGEHGEAIQLNRSTSPGEINRTAGNAVGCSLKKYKNLLLGLIGVFALAGIIFIFVSISRTNNVSENIVAMEYQSNIRLDPNVKPSHYNITLDPDFETFLFKGKVSINLEISKPVDHIRLHAQYLNITKHQLLDDIGNPVEIKLIEYVTNFEYIVLIPKEDGIKIGKYQINLEYEGNLTKNGIVGLYKSTYLDKTTNTEKHIVTSKFQPTYARRCFPGFDEPSFKSTFSISVIMPSSGMIALSNMPIERNITDTPKEGFTLVEFKKTPLMVTYLVVVAIGDFYHKETQSSSGIPIRVYSIPSNIELVDYAISISPSILDYFETKFGVKYTLPKLDCIAIPDYVSGATEHWGLISFRETSLLYNEKTSTEENKKRVATVVSHEFAHLWFGNLVTLKWWDSLWINEGFASYLEYKGVEAAEKDWDILSQFFVDDYQSAMRADGLASSHPIVQEVLNPNQITEIFDSITYSKSAAVIRMLESFMGEEAFNLGLKRILSKFNYRSTETDEIWTEFEAEFVNLTNNLTLPSLGKIMDSWTRSKGFPLIKATVNLKEGSVIMTQEQFKEIKGNSSSSPSSGKSASRHQWIIPMRIRTVPFTKKNKVTHLEEYGKLEWILPNKTSPNENFIIELGKDPQFAVLNGGQIGFYRVIYDLEYYQTIKGLITSPDLISEEKCGILDDSLVSAYTGHLNYSIPFELLNTLRNVSDPVVWICLTRHIYELSDLLFNSNKNISDQYKEYILDLVDGIYKNINPRDNIANRTHLEKLLAPKLFYLTCKFGSKDCLKETLDFFNDWIKGVPGAVKLPTSLKFSIYRWGVYQANETIWEKVKERYMNETDPIEKLNLLRALAGTKIESLINKLIEDSKNQSIVREQDFFTLFHYLADNEYGNELVWNYYRNNYESLVNRFTLNDRSFGKMILPITKNYSSDKKLKEIIEFFKMYPKPGAGSNARKTALENVQNNIIWRGRSLPSIREFLEKNKKKSKD